MAEFLRRRFNRVTLTQAIKFRWRKPWKQRKEIVLPFYSLFSVLKVTFFILMLTLIAMTSIHIYLHINVTNSCTRFIDSTRKRSRGGEGRRERGGGEGANPERKMSREGEETPWRLVGFFSRVIENYPIFERIYFLIEILKEKTFHLKRWERRRNSH